MPRDSKVAMLLLCFWGVLLSYSGNAQPKPTDEKFIIAQNLIKEGKEKNDSSKIADGYYSLAKVYESYYDYPKAYELFYTALNIFQKRKEWYNVGRVYLRMTDCELSQLRTAEAKHTLNEAVKIFKEHNIEQGIVDSYFLYGMLYSRTVDPKPNYDSALYYFKKLEAIALKKKNGLGLVGARGQIGYIYNMMKDKRAIANLEFAANSKSLIKDTPLFGYRTLLAKSYVIFDDMKRAKQILDSSQAMIGKGYDLSKNAMALHYEVFAEYYRKAGDWENAYNYREKQLAIKTELIESDRTANISQWRIKLETEKKDLELKLQKTTLDSNEKQISQQKYLLIITGVFLSILVVLLFYLYKNYQKQKQLSQHNAILIQEQNHRVKNNLQIISSLLSLQSNQLEESKAKQAVDESQLRIEAMAVLHRQLYDTQELDKIDMDVFINSLSDIIFESYGIEEIELDYQINIKPLQADKAVFLGLMINEFISNACKHAFANHPAPAFHISLSETKNEIVMQIKDNGLKPISSKKKESFGMKLINMMVHQLDGQISYEYNGGSVFTLKIA